MRRPAKILLLAIVVALLPLRSMAAVIVGCCGLAHDSIVAAQATAGAHDFESGSGKTDTHCPSALFLPACAQASLTPRSDRGGIALVQASTPAFFPETPYRPPLADFR